LNSDGGEAAGCRNLENIKGLGFGQEDCNCVGGVGEKVECGELERKKKNITRKTSP
jgi:hypothetical protein